MARASKSGTGRPLSFAQERIWLAQRLEPDSSLYGGLRATRWRGALDVPALGRALAEIVRRHQVLRSRFPLGGNGVVQEVMPAGPISLPIRALPAGDPEAALTRLLRAEAGRPFDLTRETPLRATLFRLDPADQVLALGIHHIAFDRWSRGILFGELVQLYQAFAENRPSSLAEPPRQYGDYAAWQRDRYGPGRAAPDLTYWTQRLRGAPPLMDLGADRPRPARQGHLGDRVTLVLPADLMTAMTARSRRTRATPFMALLAAFTASLARATGRTDVVVGTPVAGRLWPDLEGMIGCFTNTLVLRADLSGDPPFAEILRRIRETAVGAYAHAELPFERLVEALRPPRDPGYHPVFQVLFNFLDFPVLSAALPEVRVDEIELDTAPALVDLSVDVRRAGAGYRCDYTYDTALFDRARVERLGAGFVAILRAVGENDGLHLSALPGPAFATHAEDGLRRRLDALSPAKRALLELRLSRRRGTAAAEAPPPIAPRREPGPPPLSFAQQRLWFLDQLEPGPQYNVPCRGWLTGALDVPALRRALDELVRRHESLRTTFPAEDGRPHQAIAPPAPFALQESDLRRLAASEREPEVERLATEEARRPFDLARGPLFRGRLVRVGEQEHALLLTLHHIVGDGWSVGVLFRELGTLYEAFSRGEPSPLPQLAIQYADYAVWQRNWLQGAVLERELAYWRGRFPTIPAPLELPTDRPRPAARTSAGSRVRFSLSPELTEGLTALGLREGATLFMTLLAAFTVLLQRYSGRDDLVVGSPIAGRERPETEGVIGFFTNTLALRTDLSGDPTFLELLGRVREVALGAYAHQALPFERLVEELKPDRDLTRTPVFQVMFALQNLPRSARRLRGLTLRHIELGKGTAKFDLGLSLSDRKDGLSGVFTYSTDLLDAGSVERLARSYQVLLAEILRDPAARISRLPLLSAAERHRLVSEWNPEVPPSPSLRGIHQLVEDQAARTPDAPAVICQDQRLSYAEFNRRANRLAHALLARGVGPDAAVAVFLERSAGLAVAVLGILKAGGAYLGVDPDTPPKRMRTILADAGVRLVLTHRSASGSLPALPEGVALLGLESCEGTSGPGPADHDPVGCRSPEQLAYLIYTSGSTGLPKGVAVPHSAVASFSTTAAQIYGLGPGDRVLLSASLTSDFSVEEMFPAWVSGAAVVVRPPGPHSPGQEFSDLLEHGGVSLALIPTAFWDAWVQELHRSGRSLPRSLRIVSVGGEAARATTLDRWRTLAGSRTRWFNTYGPTEATVEATAYEPAPGVESLGDGGVSIGRPLPHARVYLLDRHLDPVPLGVAGEICIGGRALARGYLGRPALTAARFLPDPFAAEPGARLYRTGDLGRLRADGTLEFLGRLDAQVKLRGFRVEPGEIEAALSSHPDVRHAAVLVREEAPGERRLVAYLVPEPGREHSPAALRSWLRDRLPEPMLPAAFVALEALPLTPNGKVDRTALPAPGPERALGDGGFEAPRTELETAVAAIWAEVLGTDRIGVRDNFFESGGHSLLATQVIARVRAATGIELPLRVLFEAPTVAGLAERLEAGRSLLQEIAALAPHEVRSRLGTELAS